MSQENKSDSGTPSGAAGTAAAAKTDSTASAKAAAKKKHQQQKSAKATVPNPPKKKQPQQAAKSSFEGIASGVSPMKGIVIAQGNGNMAGQFRVFQTKLAGAAADDKAYGLDSAILDLIAKKRSDFVKSKPDPSVHSKLTAVLGADGKATGENKLICFDPILKDQMEAEYNMDLKFQSSNWNQYNRMEEGYYRIAIGNIDTDMITYCRTDKRMTVAESNKDLVLLLLVLRSVCAQNHGAVKVDEEYHNLGTVQSAVGYRQKKNVSNSEYAKEVLDRYGSAIFTSGKFVFGQAIYDKVLSNYSKPMTFKEYINLNDDEQIPIDKIVKERIVARLIIKNSLNERVRNELLETYSVNNNTCYPNTISEAMSLLATFKKQTNANSNSKTEEDAVVSYHEAINSEDDVEHDGNLEEIEETVYENSVETPITYSAMVMAAVIAEATAEADEEQFLGPSFEQQQDANDAYVKNEPDVVCCAHIAGPLYHDNEIEEGDTPTDEEGGGHINSTGQYPNHIHDFELTIYQTAQRIKNTSTVTTRPLGEQHWLHEHSSPVPESIIDYSDAIRYKLKMIGVHDCTDIIMIFDKRSDKEAAAYVKAKLKEVGQQGLHGSTLTILKEEAIKTCEMFNFNQIRYKQMILEIGSDTEQETFPSGVALIHHVVSAVAINQQRRKPNRWVNKVTHKLLDVGIDSIENLERELNLKTINNTIGRHGMPKFNQVTIHGLELIIGTTDFRRGRS